ncbi:DUF11 domain-containing protein [Sphingobium boeckii]|uniref:Putative repeat protein (TIGR01451 family) n=1 Tax=Sphingobium boeckii TaxID=1082345 RepID=A0A7W9AGB4_9SPHN|nr:DUF11 domain-containing protein [Sphingobium boeckii]MBB5685135.1 putative repeat protein (TIGR01451 family) [Sphingobium boeckii]
MTIKIFMMAALACATPATARAANQVSLSSAVFVEKDRADAQGRRSIVLEAPRMVTPGDKLVFMLSYRNTGNHPANDFIVTNPLPQAVSYQGTPDAGAFVSVDGGATWGTLGQLRVKERNGYVRGARPEDVTHVRWTLKQAIPAGSTGKLMFRGIVK